MEGYEKRVLLSGDGDGLSGVSGLWGGGTNINYYNEVGKMRISVKRDDKNYHPKYRHCRVKLNGINCDHVHTADDEKGEVLCNAKDEYGEFIIESGTMVTITRRGKVEIVWPEDEQEDDGWEIVE